MSITPGAGVHPDLRDDVEETLPPGPGTHPDLVDEGRAAKSAGSTAPGAEQTSTQTTPMDQETLTPPDTGAEATVTDADQGEGPADTKTPAWLEELRNAKDPKAALAVLTANLTPEELVSDNRIGGLVGDRAVKRAQQIIDARDADVREAQKVEAAQRGDLYTLGELTAPEVLMRLRQDADARAMEPLMEGVKVFQSRLPAEVQAEVAGRTWPGTPSEGLAAYMEAVTQSAIKHGLMPEVEREIKRRDPMLRKQVLTEAHGEEPAPELLNGGPRAVREFTSEQIDNMSLEEFNQYFDDNGFPKPGVKHIVTRYEPLQRR